MTDPAEALKLAHEIVEDYTNARNSSAGPTLGLVRANVVAQALIDRTSPVEAHLMEISRWWMCPCGEVLGTFDIKHHMKFCPNCGKAIKWK